MASEIRLQRLAALSAVLLFGLGGASGAAPAWSAEQEQEQEPGTEPEQAEDSEPQAQALDTQYVPRSTTLFDAMDQGEVLVVKIVAVDRETHCPVPGDLTVPVTSVDFDVIAVVKQITPASAVSVPLKPSAARANETPSAALARGAPLWQLPWDTVCMPPRRHENVLVAGGLVEKGDASQLWVPAGYPYFFIGQTLLVVVRPPNAPGEGAGLSFVRESLAFEVAPSGALFRASDGRAVLGVRERPRENSQPSAVSDPAIELGAPAIPSAASFFASNKPGLRRRRYPARGDADGVESVILALQKTFKDGGGELAAKLCGTAAAAAGARSTRQRGGGQRAAPWTGAATAALVPAPRARARPACAHG
jgi:hypothetical protein